MAPEQSESATKDLRVINCIDLCVLNSNLLDYIHVIVHLQLLVTTKQHENVVVINIIIIW